ncbi:MAG: DUF362 domain-containing protein [Promethearchaeota archaeon]
MVKISKIAISKVENDDVEGAVFKALKLMNARSIMKKGMVVLLKPNMLSAKPPERAVCTHPLVLKAVIKWVKQFEPKRIVVGDSSGGISPNTTRKVIKASGLGQVCEEEGVEIIPFEATPLKIYPVANSYVLDEIISTSLIQEADLIINLPKIKTHGLTKLTCCIKNMFGTLILANKQKIHARFPNMKDFSKALVDVYSISKPQLTIVDGYYCQEGQGPSAGDVVKLDIILAGNDPVALDTAACKIIGIDPESVLHVKFAAEKGIGTMNFSKVNVKGVSINEVRRKFKSAKLSPFAGLPLPRVMASYLSEKIYKADLYFDPDKCVLCGTCWKNCPVNAIIAPQEGSNRKTPIWNKERCISCYCCSETCLHEAIEFKINVIKNLVRDKLFIIGATLFSLMIFLIIVWLMR